MQRREERLGDGIVQRVADGSHRAHQPGGARRPATRDRHVERIDDELGAEMIGDRPAHDASDQASMTTAR